MHKIIAAMLFGILAVCVFGCSQGGPPPAPGTPGERLRGDGDIPGAIAEFEKVYAQKYGMHTSYNEQTKTAELYPLEDESKVNEWRKEIGLPPLEEYLKQFNIIFRPKKSCGA